MTITEFLLARTAEDEAVAAEQNGAEYFTDGAWPEGMPARVLAECAAKREIVQYVEAARADRHRSSEDDAQYRAAWWMATRLATVYADHPDYDPEWNL